MGAPRATKDIDLLIPPDHLEKALEAAQSCGFRFKALPMRFQDRMEVQRITKIQGEASLTLDLILVNETTQSVWASRIRVATELGTLSVAARDALMAMKTAAGRPQDPYDIQRLTDLDR